MILRTPDIEKITGLSKVHLWRLEKEGKFPARLKLGGRAVGWHEAAILEWIESRPRASESLKVPA